ncbi:hypothetical protein DERP_003283 [Dermatophagoides pteronyssinus]|uniref:Uncharacterized protein n=1 Tax=Dermatophagoides pteronyssinus TaxID=6956 RepID=A0ABQ8JJU2_DERPT|nr:hypothetical protein DERP_003283 [Dermatophagoides pteronyssinus]
MKMKIIKPGAINSLIFGIKNCMINIDKFLRIPVIFFQFNARIRSINANVGCLNGFIVDSITGNESSLTTIIDIDEEKPIPMLIIIFFRKTGSTPTVGSSNINNGGECINATANDTRRFCPPLRLLI